MPVSNHIGREATGKTTVFCFTSGTTTVNSKCDLDGESVPNGIIRSFLPSEGPEVRDIIDRLPCGHGEESVLASGSGYGKLSTALSIKP